MTAKEKLIKEHNKLSARGEPDPKTEAARKERLAQIESELESNHGLSGDMLDKALMDDVAPEPALDTAAPHPPAQPALPQPDTAPGTTGTDIGTAAASAANTALFSAQKSTKNVAPATAKAEAKGVQGASKLPTLPQPAQQPALPDVPVPDALAEVRAATDAVAKKMDEMTAAQKQREHDAAVAKGKAEFDAVKKNSEERAAWKKENPAQFLSEKRWQIFKDAEKMSKSGMSAQEIAAAQAKKIYTGSTNVLAKDPRITPEFMEQNNLTDKMLGTKSDIQKEGEWADQFKNRKDQPQQPAQAAPAQVAPNLAAITDPNTGRKLLGFSEPKQDPLINNPLANHFGQDWQPIDGEDASATRARRADLLRASVMNPAQTPDTAPGWHLPQPATATGSGVQYGTAGLGEGEIVPKVPGAAAPAGANAFVSPYGSGFATNTSLPSTVPIFQTKEKQPTLPS